MTSVRLPALLGLLAIAAALPVNGYEVNAWPAAVFEKDAAGKTVSWTGAGPLLFSGQAPAPDKGTAQGFRPFYVRVKSEENVKTDILYPLFFFRKYPDAYKWSVFQLINGEGIDRVATLSGQPTDRHLDIWPLYFSHETGDPRDSYRALLPFYGTVFGRLGFDRLSWVLFPLYVDAYKRHTDVTYVPFPFVRISRGDANGFGIWPLFGSTRGPGNSRHAFFLWPFGWDNAVDPPPESPAGTAPKTQLGILPLYTRDTGPGSISENYFWPFFGYTELTIPDRYSEKRYFWPFLVQGRGDTRYVNRWGPFYTYSNDNGYDSTLGPLAPLAQDDLGRRGPPPVQDPVFLLSVLVPGAAERVPPVARPWLQEAHLAPPQHLGQRRRQPPGRIPERVRSLLPRQSGHPRDLVAPVLGLPLRPAPHGREPERAPLGGPHVEEQPGRRPLRIPRGAAPWHAPAALRPILDHLRIRFWSKSRARVPG